MKILFKLTNQKQRLGVDNHFKNLCFVDSIVQFILDIKNNTKNSKKTH